MQPRYPRQLDPLDDDVAEDIEEVSTQEGNSPSGIDPPGTSVGSSHRATPVDEPPLSPTSSSVTSPSATTSNQGSGNNINNSSAMSLLALQPPPRRMLSTTSSATSGPSPTTTPGNQLHHHSQQASRTNLLHQPHGVSYIGPSSSNVSTGNTSSVSAAPAQQNRQTSLLMGSSGGTAQQQQQQQQQMLSFQQQQQLVSMESPLPPVVQRSLGDRSTEKRKNAALEIEALVKSLMEANNLAMIHSVITVLSKDFCTSMNSNYRKGGLVGLAATAIGLLHHSRQFLNVLLPPVLHCFDDPESRVRYYACESLYNIAKVARQTVLDRYFTHIWEGLTKLFADVDVDVKNGANLLDRLVKDIVTEADNFRLDQFLPLLQTYIRRTNPYIRQLIVGWITFLDSIPDISMLDYLPDFLDGLFNMLSDTNREIRQAADSALAEFLRELAVSTVVDLGPVVSILVSQCQSKERLNRFTAITWLTEIIHHPYSGGDAILPFHAQILSAILFCISDGEKEIRLVAEGTNDYMMQIVRKTQATFELKRLLETLTAELLAKEDVPTKMACLRWINMLMEKRKSDMNSFTESLLPVLLRTLSDPSDPVVLLDLQALSRISVSKQVTDDGLVEEREEVQFQLVLNAILNLFAQDRQLLETRGSLIIRKLCVLLNAKSVYIRMADTLASYGEPSSDDEPPETSVIKFISTMVQTLSIILLTASELTELRAALARSFSEETEEGRKVFVTLFHCWCHNPVSTFALCLLARAYDLSFALVKRFAEMRDISVGFLMQIDKLVQLLESPIFIHLRLQLLDVESPQHKALLKSIYGLLMCLPQGDAFRLLNDRLTTVCNLRDNLGMDRITLGSSQDEDVSIVGKTGLSMDRLLERFDDVLEQHNYSSNATHKMMNHNNNNHSNTDYTNYDNSNNNAMDNTDEIQNPSVGGSLSDGSTSNDSPLRGNRFSLMTARMNGTPNQRVMMMPSSRISQPLGTSKTTKMAIPTSPGPPPRPANKVS